MTDRPALHLPDDAATLALGRRLADGVEPGASLYLHGDLGAGKTTLVRGLLRGLGFDGRAKSPTFALVELYDLSKLSLYHFDFYRFDQPAEFRDSGLSEQFGTDAICVVEWPQKAGDFLPLSDLDIHLQTGGSGGRDALFEAHTPRGQRWLTSALA